MSEQLRIIVGGIMHETNSFTPLPTTYERFAIYRGNDRYVDRDGALAPFDTIDLVTTFVADARPGGLVERKTFERLKNELLDEIKAALPADGLLLDLHGAMEVEQIGDGESDLIAAIRALVGDDMVIALSLDLHGNISPALIAQANILTAYRSAPHRDERETRRRALGLLVDALQKGQRPVAAMVKLPLQLAGEVAVTDNEPAQSLYAGLPTIAATPGLLDATIMIGCAWTDSAYATVSAIVVAEADRALAQQHAANLAAQIWARRGEFGFAVEALELDEAIAAALSSDLHPVYISDSGDNMTAGAPGDRPLALERLLAAGATDTLVAGLVDAPAVRACAAAGVGATVPLQIGATIDVRGGPPLQRAAFVERVDGEEAAVVRIEGVRVILTSTRVAFTERSQMIDFGVDPDAQRIIVVKLGYLFPDLAAHARRALMALTPGACTLQLSSLPYQKLPRPIYPLDGDVEWKVDQ